MKISNVLLRERKGFVFQSCVYGMSIMWIASLLSVRIFPVPMTMQTCGVQMIAFLMSPIHAFYAIASWLFAGAMGVPCFSGGGCGVESLFGPLFGYRLGMLVSAPLMSFLMRKYQQKGSGTFPKASFQSLFSSSFLGVVLTLSLGCCVLSLVLGSGHKAWCVGVSPFLYTDTLKAVFGCLVIKGILVLRDKS